MRRSTSDRYTILITRTGGLPITLSVNPGPIVLLMAIAALTPVVWLGSRVSSLHRQNQELATQNQELSQAANDVFKEIEELDSEISTLRERAGLSEAGFDGAVDEVPFSPTSLRQESQGGLNEALDAVDAFKAAKDQLPDLVSTLDKQVKPALNETLAEEFAEKDARPSIRPVNADLKMSSKFGGRPNPFGWGYEFHNGIDFPGPVGTPIISTAPGVVTKADWGGGYGYHVVIDHGYGYETLYAHLSEVKVDKGDTVERSDVVGLLGNTGRSTGPHLHYSVYEDGELVDPEEYLD